MTKDEFERFYWAYYLMLENKFIATNQYVFLNRDNFATYSIEYVHLLLAICSAFENSLQEFPDYPKDKWDKIRTFLLNNFTGTQPIVTMPDYPDIKLYPLPQVSGKEKLDISWWEAYNNSKHSWALNISSANLGNTLNALAALFVVCMIFIKKASTDVPDIPMKESALFVLKNVSFKAFRFNNTFGIKPDIPR